MKFCDKCGSPVNDGAPFCNNCGAPVNQGGQPQNAQPPQGMPPQNTYTPMGGFPGQQPPQPPKSGVDMKAMIPSIIAGGVALVALVLSIIALANSGGSKPANNNPNQNGGYGYSSNYNYGGGGGYNYGYDW